MYKLIILDCLKNNFLSNTHVASLKYKFKLLLSFNIAFFKILYSYQQCLGYRPVKLEPDVHHCLTVSTLTLCGTCNYVYTCNHITVNIHNILFYGASYLHNYVHISFAGSLCFGIFCCCFCR